MTTLKPVYLLAGGRQSQQETENSLIQTIFRESGATFPRVVYLGTANGDDRGSFNRMASLFKVAGAGEVSHALISPKGADLEKAKQLLSSGDIIFVSGGDVDLGIHELTEKRMIGFLRKLYEEGKPFFGRSAGSIMLAKSWVRWRDPADDSTAELFPCLDFAPVICDTHGEQDGWEELRVALRLTKNGEIGYGIVSGAAIKVYPDGTVEGIGGAIHLFTRRWNQVIRISDLLPIA